MVATDSDIEAFVRSIKADPTDPSRRLVFADYLDDRGLDGDAQRVAVRVPVIADGRLTWVRNTRLTVADAIRLDAPYVVVGFASRRRATRQLFVSPQNANSPIPRPGYYGPVEVTGETLYVAETRFVGGRGERGGLSERFLLRALAETVDRMVPPSGPDRDDFVRRLDRVLPRAI
jgi:uncharacterized protein (TIGR02996 family)